MLGFLLKNFIFLSVKKELNYYGNIVNATEGFVEDRLRLSLDELLMSVITFKDFIEIMRDRDEFDSYFDKMWKAYFPIPPKLEDQISYRTAINPSDYADAIFPFLEKAERYDTKKEIKYVNPWKVIGGNYQRHEIGSKEIIEEKIRQLNENGIPNNSVDEIFYIIAAQYEEIRPFGIFVAIEGKNRVKLYRIANKKIKALITPVEYFKSEELEILNIKKTNIYYAVLKNDGSKKMIPFPHITVPILRKYGVAFKVIDKSKSYLEEKIDEYHNLRILIKKRIQITIQNMIP